jgi:subtilisin family serine protease
MGDETMKSILQIKIFLLIISIAFYSIAISDDISNEICADVYIPYDLAIDYSKDEVTAGLLIITNGTTNELEDIGIEIHSRIGSIITTRVPIDMIDTVASLESVLHCQIAKKMHINLNQSAPYVNADNARNLFGVTGNGVIIGIVDDGIDIANADFQNGTNDTRIQYLWVQHSSTGSAPSPYNYGSEYTKNDIDNNTTNYVYYGTHGTMVAGIAAGSGRATGGGVPESTYVGIAPGADIICVAAHNSSNSATGMFAADYILDAITYIVNKANSLNKPCVINISLSSATGPRDGTSVLEMAVDSLLQNNTGKGLSIVVAAGNKGYDPSNAEVILHDSTDYKWASNKSHSVFYGFDTLKIEVGASGYQGDKAYFDIWYPGHETAMVTLFTPNRANTIGPYGPGYGTGSPHQGYCFTFGFVSIHNEHWGTGLYRDPWPTSTDKVIRIQLADIVCASGTKILTPGVWELEITLVSGQWDAYLWYQYHEWTGYVSFFQDWTNDGQVEEPGCA